MNKQELNKIMNINVNNVAKIQHDSLKQFVLDKIDELRNLVETEQYEKVKDLAFFSDCGDGWGEYSREDYCINFAYLDNDEEDLIEVIDRLINAKNNIK